MWGKRGRVGMRRGYASGLSRQEDAAPERVPRLLCRLRCAIAGPSGGVAHRHGVVLLVAGARPAALLPERRQLGVDRLETVALLGGQAIDRVSVEGGTLDGEGIDAINEFAGRGDSQGGGVRSRRHWRYPPRSRPGHARAVATGTCKVQGGKAPLTLL